MEKYIRKFEIFNSKNGEIIEKIGENNNRIVYDGREAWLDMMFGVETWFSGVAGYDSAAAASGIWHPNRVIAIGTVADSNDGFLNNNSYLDGGSGIKADSVATGSNIAYFPNLNDHYMSSALSGNGAADEYNTGTALFYKTVDRVVRTARTIQIEATFNTTIDPGSKNITTLLTGTEIREMGIFLGGTPTGTFTPSTVRADRPYSMLCRSVRYAVSGGYIQDSPLIAGANDITVRYTFGENP